MRQIKKGATDQTVYLEVLDTTSTTGGRKTNLVHNTSSLTCYWHRPDQATLQAVSLVTQTINGAHTDGGFIHLGTNMAGVYRLDMPDAAFAAGADTVVITLRGAADMAQVSLEIQLVDPVADLLDAAAGVETNLTLRQFLRLATSALFSKSSGMGTSTVTMRDYNDSKDRIVAMVDADGNRSAFGTRDAT
jgi:hypothetical protein